MKIEIFIAISLCLVFVIPTQATNVRVGISSKVLTFPSIQMILWSQLQNFLAGDIPSVVPTNFSCCTNFTEIKYNYTSASPTSTELLQDVGIRFNFTAFSTMILWTLHWKNESKTGVLHGNSSITLDTSLTITVLSNAGVPNFKVLNMEIKSWSIVPENYPLPPALNKAPEEAIQTLITGNIFKNAFIEDCENTANSLISGLFGSGSMEILLNISKISLPVFLNYSISEGPNFNEKYISLGLEVGIRLNNTKCPLQDKLPTMNQTHDVLVSISRTIIDCLSNDVATTNLGLYALEKKIVDSRFQADIFATPKVSFVPSNLTTTLLTNFDLPVSGIMKTIYPMNNTVYDLAKFSVNASTIIKIVLHLDRGSADFGLEDKSLKITHLSCNPVPNSPLVHTPYYNQLNEENWDGLIKKILSLLPPEIYTLQSYALPSYFGLFNTLFKDIGWVVYPDYFTIQADFKLGSNK